MDRQKIACGAKSTEYLKNLSVGEVVPVRTVFIQKENCVKSLLRKSASFLLENVTRMREIALHIRFCGLHDHVLVRHLCGYGVSAIIFLPP